MEKETEEAKEKTNRRKVAIALQGSSFSSAHSLAHAYLKKHKEGKSLGLPNERKYDLSDKIWGSSYILMLENAYSRLSENTQKELKSNYSEATMKEILEALQNFESVILIAENTQKMAEEAIKFKKEASRGIRDIDSLMKNALIAEKGKVILQLLKKGFQEYESNFRELKTDEIGMVKLWDSFLDPLQLHYAFRDYDPEIPLTEESIEESILKKFSFIIVQQKGRPSKTSFKALQIIIYKLLTVEAPKKKASYVQWTKKITATIINDFFARWRDPSFYTEAHPNSGLGFAYGTFGPWKIHKLTAKDIDNSLYSSS